MSHPQTSRKDHQGRVLLLTGAIVATVFAVLTLIAVLAAYAFGGAGMFLGVLVVGLGGGVFAGLAACAVGAAMQRTAGKSTASQDALGT